MIWGLPLVNAAAFVIRVFHLGGHEIRSNPVERDQLVAAIKSMTPESRRYKGLEGSVDAVIEWLMRC